MPIAVVVMAATKEIQVWNTQAGLCRSKVSTDCDMAILAWEAAKWIFTDVISAQSARYRSTYGGVASVVLTLLWIYFSSMILLLGAEAAAVYEEMCGENKETRETAN